MLRLSNSMVIKNKTQRDYALETTSRPNCHYKKKRGGKVRQGEYALN